MKFGSLRSTSVSGLTGGNGGPSKLFTNRSNSARAAKMRDIAKQIEQMRIIQNQRSEKSSPATSSTSGTGCTTINTTSGPTSSGSTSPSNSAVAHPTQPVEQLQHQVQIRDLKTISMNTTSSSNSNSDHHHTSMLAKLQNVMNGETNGAAFLNRSSPKQMKV